MSATQPDYYDHPVFNADSLHLRTQPMEQLNEILHQWMWNGATGGLVIGPPRSGKTRCIRSLSSQLYTRGNIPVPVYYMAMPSRDQQTIVSVFRQLCWSANLQQRKSDRADHLSERFIHYVLDQASEKQCQNAVLVVDEMQRLVPKQFNAFAEIYDNLLLMGINLMVVFLGNDQECSRLIEIIEDPGYAHIHGRFFTQGYLFRGLSSRDEVKQCLEQYDQLRYPENGPTYTEYFLPKEFKKGWKISHLSEDLWRVFRGYQKNYDIDTWGMKYFTVAANTLLSDFLPAAGIENFCDEMVHECIRVSGLIPSQVRPH